MVHGAASTTQVDLSEFLNNPTTYGEGTLFYSDQVDTETITLGNETGIYGMGVVLKGEWLSSDNRDLRDKKFITQVFLGTRREKLENKVPVFGMASLIGVTVPTETTAFTFQMPLQKGDKNSPAVILAFSSPKTLLNQSDQDQLQSTFFGNSGGINITPVGNPAQIQVKGGEGKISLKKQNMKFDFVASLATPFNGLEKKLTGSIVFPIYSAQGKQSEAWFKKIGNALNVPSFPKPSPQSPSRKITGSPQKTLEE